MSDANLYRAAFSGGQSRFFFSDTAKDLCRGSDGFFFYSSFESNISCLSLSIFILYRARYDGTPGSLSLSAN